MEDSSEKQMILERFREYLLLLAKMQLGDHGRDKVEPSDVVQQTLLEAYRKREQFRGDSDAELAGWLRAMLAMNLADALRAQNRAKRSVARERSLQEGIEASSQRLEGLLPADISSPSMRAQRHEDLLQLAKALADLPETQREALVMRHCHGMSLAEISQKLDKSAEAVAGLLKRGFKHLREVLGPEKQP